MRKKREMINRNFIIIFCLYFLAFPKISFSEDEIKISENSKLKFAVIRVLDKISAKSKTIEVELKKEIELNNNISVKAYQCWKAPSYKAPETKILLKVLNNEKKEIFFGWLFASSPSISGIEHAIYDIVAIDCK